MRLAFSALVRAMLGFALFAVLLFLPAGTWAYFGGWLFILCLFVPMLLLGTVLALFSPTMLQKRLDMREEQSGQKAVILLCALVFLLGFVLAGLDFRFGWTQMPVWLTVTAAPVFLFGYALYAETIRENAYLSRTVKVEEGQTVVDTGLYGIVRHPMYAATLLMFLAVPIMLGSLYAFCAFLFYPVLIVVRICGEEKLLLSELRGYAAYTAKVKYRLIPFIW